MKFLTVRNLWERPTKTQYIIQKAYIRTEDKKSYVYLRDKKTKRLKKQYINDWKDNEWPVYRNCISGCYRRR